MGFSLKSGAGVDGNAPYQAQELQITTLATIEHHWALAPFETIDDLDFTFLVWMTNSALEAYLWYISFKILTKLLISSKF